MKKCDYQKADISNRAPVVKRDILLADNFHGFSRPPSPEKGVQESRWRLWKVRILPSASRKTGMKMIPPTVPNNIIGRTIPLPATMNPVCPQYSEFFFFPTVTIQMINWSWIIRKVARYSQILIRYRDLSAKNPLPFLYTGDEMDQQHNSQVQWQFSCVRSLAMQ